MSFTSNLVSRILVLVLLFQFQRFTWLTNGPLEGRPDWDRVSLQAQTHTVHITRGVNEGGGDATLRNFGSRVDPPTEHNPL